MQEKKRIPDPTISRLALYWRALNELKNKGVAVVSSRQISQLSGVKAAQFRKDLSYFGEFGIQGLGYQVDNLLERISSIMGLQQEQKVILVGAGNLGKALAFYPGFSKWGFRIVKIYDQDPQVIGQQISDITVEDISDIAPPIPATMAILAIPKAAAQACAQKLADAGIQGILNFSGANLDHLGIPIKQVDLTNELAILTYHLNKMEP